MQADLKQTRKKRRVEVKKEPKEDPDAAPAMKLVILDDGVIDLTWDLLLDTGGYFYILHSVHFRFLAVGDFKVCHETVSVLFNKETIVL